MDTLKFKNGKLVEGKHRLSDETILSIIADTSSTWGDNCSFELTKKGSRLYAKMTEGDDSFLW